MARLALHATAVAWGARAALILGRSGSGKSALALDLMAWGCALVADDRVMVWAEAGDLRVAAPASLRGLVEARGVGLLRAEALAEAQVVLLVDLDAAEPGRLPPWRERLVAGVPLPCLQKPATGHFAAAILQYLKAGRAAPAPPEAPAGARPSQDASRAAMPPEPIEAETPHAEVSPAGSGAGWPGPEVWGRRVVLVTGPSGAGRSTAIRALEDLGFEVIDNLPLSLLPRLLEGGAPGRPLALGLDVRNRDWTEGAIARALDRLAGAAGPGRGEGPGAEVLFLDCADEVLLRRFSETRRRHPLAPDGAPAAGIARERELLAGLRERADLLVDTTELGPHDLRARLDAAFAPPGGRPFAVSIESFSYKRGLPGGLDMAFDCRFLRNPHWDAGLRPLDGRDEGVAAFVRADPRYAPFLERLRDLLLSLLPAFREEGKAHLAVGLGCTGGQHRSVTLALDLAKALADGGWQVSSRHRELERRAEAAGAAGVGTTR